MMWFISIFVAALLGWSAILWLVLPLDIFKYSLTSIIAMHLAIPAGIVSVWYSIRYWIDAAKQKKAAANEAAQRDIREAEKARQKHLFDEALRNRRVNIDCRWAVTADVIFHGEATPLTENTEQAATHFYTAPSSVISSWPQNALVELFDDLFNAMPGAMTLPIAVCGPVAQAGTEHEQLIRQARQKTLARHQNDFSKLVSSDVIPLSSDGRGIFAAIHDAFMRRRDWPAIVVVAFDNCIVDMANDFDMGAVEGSLSESEKWQGKAGRAISVLLLSQPELIDVLTKLDTLGEGVAIDSLTPYWERQKIPAGMAGHLIKWPKAWRENFASMQPIARLHRASVVALPDSEPISQRAQKTEAAIIEAAINASLRDLDFVFEGEVESAEARLANDIGKTGWLFHNAGDISCCGDRVAAISLAMWKAGIELNPIDQATNTVMTIGDCGVAARYVWLALAMQRVAVQKKPALCIEFIESELAAGFVVPFLPAE
ncbi:MAG: hypothetical protein QM709_09975 [Spongiibacteraceae bacterium]